MIKQYIRYLFKAGNEHDLHSPFVYNFYLDFLKNDIENQKFVPIETLRKQLKKDKSEFEIEDFGAGGQIEKFKKRKISAIAKKSLKAPKFARLMFRIIGHFKPKIILDLGTSFGITTAYLATANPEATVYSFEGCLNTAKIAGNNFEKLGLKNINIKTGNIDKTLPELVNDIEKVDFAFFDANHRLKPTMNYFEICLTKTHSKSILIFDDIYWSDEMQEAWRQIKADDRVGITIDLFFIGIVFLRKEQAKQNFVLKY